MYLCLLLSHGGLISLREKICEISYLLPVPGHSFGSIYCNVSCRLVGILFPINWLSLSWSYSNLPKVQRGCRKESRKSNILFSNSIAFLDQLEGEKCRNSSRLWPWVNKWYKNVWSVYVHVGFWEKHDKTKMSLTHPYPYSFHENHPPCAIETSHLPFYGLLHATSTAERGRLLSASLPQSSDHEGPKVSI